MARRLMSRRGNSASQPQVTPYQQHEVHNLVIVKKYCLEKMLDDGWREWENTKQELVLVKRQLTEKDALILQLKTASRRLQETLRKKDKDLQAAFAILRSPQDAKTTKTRKQELIDRLVSECTQRAATSEALAEERRKEIDHLKYSRCGAHSHIRSKFLRFQELEVEIEECHMEIDRLRAKLETTAASSPTAIAGKLKVSAVPLASNVSGTYKGILVKKNKLEPLNLQEQESPDSRQNVDIPRMNSTLSATGQVRVVPLAKYDHREGFVSKTRRRALEAEYYKQVRLAQLEVECELEENLHIRAAREAKRLEATEYQERRTDFIINSARSQQSTSRNNDPGEEDVQRNVTTNKEGKDVDKADESSGKQVAEDSEASAPEKNSENDESCDEVMEVKSEKKTYEDDGSDDVTDDHCKETGFDSAWNVDPKLHYDPEPYQNDATDDDFKETRPGTIWNMNPISENKPGPYQNENGSATDNCNDTNPGTIWNVDPHPERKSDPYPNESKSADTAQDNGESSMKSTAWNVDPEPSNIEAGEGDPDRVIWNADPNPGDPVDDVPVAYSDDEDDDHEAAGEQDSTVSNDNANVWSLPPSPSLHTEEKSGDPVVSHKAESDSVQENSNDDDNGREGVWNVDPTPTSLEYQAATNMTETTNGNPTEVNQPVWNLDPEPTNVAENDDEEHLPEVNQSVWNLDPEPAPVLDAISSSEEIQHNHDDANDEISLEKAVVSAAEEIVHAESSSGKNPNLVTDNPSSNAENGECPWNLEPKVPTPPSSNTEEGQIPQHNDADELSSGTKSAQVKADHTDTNRDPDTNTVWNLSPSASEPVSNFDSEGGNEEDNTTSVWNLDPHTGDSSGPPDTSTIVAVSELKTAAAQEDEQFEGSRSEDAMETPADGTEAPVEYPTTFPQHFFIFTHDRLRRCHRRGCKCMPGASLAKLQRHPNLSINTDVICITTAQNSPLYIRTFGEEGEDLGFHYIAHVSLDVIEEKLRGAGVTTSKDDMYLGFLGPIEDYRVYGYVTNTSVKFVVVLQDAPVRESELRPFFSEVHRLYVNAMSNPFAPLGERLTSQTFDKRVSNLVVQHNTSS
ncbi:Trafficking protein particle complex subunit 2-like protein [Phytophthora citrophthora]|uniref:Trafficking protein particle complex subunit 2-like protein n=1 Tax=Phytophthora citrophthora TaxID=4793 RepID=A0AAD9GTQ9_9STRA|nr:Trafficking protein particle complex subunit 2-like protein [Phytophthora citrophthora]